MVPEIGSQFCEYVPSSPSVTKTISISIRRGTDGCSSSIVLPCKHHLAKHLERLMSYSTPALQQTQILTQESAGYDVIRALSSVVKYIHTTNPHHQTPDSRLSALYSSLRPPSDHVNASVINTDNQQTNRHRRSADCTAIHTRNHRRTRSTKHCKVLGCSHISVSRGLCRGHGGGRRCHYIGCMKSAQSRSVFCWSHGGGRRCEVESCMRSRKSKRFCADHVHLEDVATPHPPRKGINPLKMILNDVNEEVVPPQTPRNASLPSLQDALRNTQQTSMMF